MKKIFKKSVSILLAAVMLCCAMPFAGVVFGADAAENKGVCGADLDWTFDSEQGVLTVEGTGAMTDYLAKGSPWYDVCSEIKSVVISDGAAGIGNNAFYDCANLSSVSLPESVSSIGMNAFRNCESLENIELSDSLSSIGDAAFYFTGLKNVTIPASVEEIGTDAFGWCAYLEAFTVEAGNNNFSCDENGVLYNSDKTALIKYPSGRKSVSFDIPETVISLADYAFENCYTISEVSVPASVEDIGCGAFFNCYLENINVDARNACYSSKNGVLFDKTESVLILYPANNDRTNYSVPETVKTIDESAFHNNITLKSIVIPDSVTTLADEAFLYCDSLEYIHIPSSVTEIGADIADPAYVYICSDTENCYAKEYAAENGFTFKICENHGVSDITLSETEIEIKNKSSYTLTATVLPETADDKTVVWSSDNKNVAEVDENGTVTAVSIGTANITAASNDGGKTATCKVTVTPRQFRITWIVDGTETVKYQNEESEISTPDNPYKIGYNFDGWTPQIPDAMPAEDMTFTAQFSINSYKAAFFAEGGKWTDGTEEKIVTTVYQDEISIPEAPERTGYEFAGWTPQIPDAMPARYLEFNAEWTPVSCNAVFDANGGEWVGGETVITVPTDFDSQIEAPEAPEKQGYVFDGWTPEVGVMNDVNGKAFAAKWVPAADTKYTVEIYTMEIGGEYTIKSEALTGTTEAEVKAEYTVETGFVLNEEISTLSGVVAADGSLVLRVCYDRLKSEISFNGETVECWFGEIIEEPSKPAAPEGYVQSGWVDENGDIIEFPLVLTEDFPKEIKANFVVNSFVVRWNIDGAINEETYTYQSVINKPDDPEKEGYIFKGWTPDIPDKMPAYDMEFTAVFERIVYRCSECGFETYDEAEYNEHMAYEQSKKDVRISIKNNPGTAKIKYGETLKLTAVTTLDVADTKIVWYVDGVKQGEGETFSISFKSGTKTVAAKISDANGNILKDADGNEISDSQKVSVNSGFWQKIVSFFKNLFGMNRTVVQLIRK